MHKYSLFNLLKAYKENKSLCDAYLKGESIEGMDDDSNKIAGFTIGIFLVFLMVSLILFVIALVLLIKNWNQLEDWAKIVGIIGFFFPPPGHIVTIIVVMIGKKK